MDDIKDLYERARAGDSEGKLALINVLEPIRLGLERRFSYFQREDLDQELILVVLESISSYEGDLSSFSWYVKMKSYWYCLDKAKKTMVLDSLNVVNEKTGQEEISMLTSGETLEEDFFKDEEGKRILAFINSLDRSERLVVFNFYYRNIPLKDIGREMGVSASSVSRIHKRGLKKLKKLMGNSLEFQD